MGKLNTVPPPIPVSLSVVFDEWGGVALVATTPDGNTTTLLENDEPSQDVPLDRAAELLYRFAKVLTRVEAFTRG